MKESRKNQSLSIVNMSHAPFASKWEDEESAGASSRATPNTKALEMVPNTSPCSSLRWSASKNRREAGTRSPAGVASRSSDMLQRSGTAKQFVCWATPRCQNMLTKSRSATTIGSRVPTAMRGPKLSLQCPSASPAPRRFTPPQR